MARARKRVYVAGPLFSDQDRRKLEDLDRALRGLGFVNYLPHKHGGDLGSSERGYGSEKTRRDLFARDMRALEKADLVVALLDGADVDSGTAFEAGYAHRCGIPVFGLKSDYHRRGRVLNNMLWGACARGKRVAFTVPGLLALLRNHLRRTSRAAHDRP